VGATTLVELRAGARVMAERDPIDAMAADAAWARCG